MSLLTRFRAPRRTVWVEQSGGGGHWASNWELAEMNQYELTIKRLAKDLRWAKALHRQWCENFPDLVTDYDQELLDVPDLVEEIIQLTDSMASDLADAGNHDGAKKLSIVASRLERIAG